MIKFIQQPDVLSGSISGTSHRKGLTGTLSSPENLNGYLSNIILRGIPVELRIDDKMLQWKYTDEDDTRWRDLIDLGFEEAIADISSISYHICITGEYNPATFVPTISGEAGTIYLVPKSVSETNNIYYEFIYNNASFEKIGDTEIDLSDYLNTSDIASSQDITDMLDEVYERS